MLTPNEDDVPDQTGRVSDLNLDSALVDSTLERVVDPTSQRTRNLDENFERSLKLQMELRLKYPESSVESSVDSLTSRASNEVRRRRSFPWARGSSRKNISGVEALKYREREQVLSEAWLTDEMRAQSKRRRDLFFKGVPVILRGKVWAEAVGDDMDIAQGLYEVLEEDLEKGLGDSETDASESMKQLKSLKGAISLDAPRTFPELLMFHYGELQLTRLLEMYVLFRPRIGYTQGMSIVAGMLVLHMDNLHAFRTFANLVESTCLIDFYLMRTFEVKTHLKTHEALLSAELPDLRNHLVKQGVKPDMYLVPWFMSLYCRSMPLELACRLFDLIALDGNTAIFRVAMGLMKHLSNRLLRCGFDECMHLLTKFPQYENIDQVMNSVRSVTLHEKRLQQVHTKCATELKRTAGKLAPGQFTWNSG